MQEDELAWNHQNAPLAESDLLCRTTIVHAIHPYPAIQVHRLMMWDVLSFPRACKEENDGKENPKVRKEASHCEAEKGDPVAEEGGPW